jgi:hypothetical protein
MLHLSAIGPTPIGGRSVGAEMHSLPDSRLVHVVLLSLVNARSSLPPMLIHCDVDGLKAPGRSRLMRLGSAETVNGGPVAWVLISYVIRAPQYWL